MIINGHLYINEHNIKKFHIERESISKNNVHSIKVGYIISIDTGYGGTVISTVKIVSDFYIILQHVEGEQALSKKDLCDWYKLRAYKVLWIKKLPEDFAFLSRKITKSVLRGWYLKGYEVAKDAGLLWYLKDKCSLLVDNNLHKFLERNKVTQEEFEELIAKESDDYSKPLKG